MMQEQALTPKPLNTKEPTCCINNSGVFSIIGETASWGLLHQKHLGLVWHFGIMGQRAAITSGDGKQMKQINAALSIGAIKRRRLR